jgi:hypothetical protein
MDRRTQPQIIKAVGWMPGAARIWRAKRRGRFAVVKKPKFPRRVPLAYITIINNTYILEFSSTRG